jgi:hypothetical protein
MHDDQVYVEKKTSGDLDVAKTTKLTPAYKP